MLAAGLFIATSCSNTTTTSTEPWHTQSTSTTLETSENGSEDPLASTTTVTFAEGTPPTTIAIDGEIIIALDGWSYLTLDGAQVQARVDGGLQESIEFHPASAEEIALLRKDAPEWISNVGGRLVNTDRGWKCNTTGCLTSRGIIENIDDLLAEPATIPGYGESYRSWGMESGVYLATLPTMKNASMIDLTTDTGFTSALLNADEGSLRVLPFGDEGKGLVTAAAGLGVFFELDVWWAKDGEFGAYTFYGLPNEGIVEYDDAEYVDAFVNGAGTSGLSAVEGNPYLAAVHPSELTFLTSPTVGCGIWVTCAPGVDRGELVELISTDTTQVCVTGETTASGNEEPVVAVFTDEIRKLDLPVVSHVNGVWGGATPDQFPDAEAAGERLFGQPPLVSGTTELRVSSVRLYTTGVGGTISLWTSAGRTLEIGADDPAKVEGEYTLEDALHLFGGAVGPCA